MKWNLIKKAFVVALLPGVLAAALFAPPTFIEGDTDHPFEMGYEKDGVRFGFFSNGEEVTLALEIPSQYWDILTPSEQMLFRDSEEGNHLFGYTNSLNDPWDEARGIFVRRDAARFGAPLEYANAVPTVIGKFDLQGWVDGRKVLFYSGAGLSKVCGIPDMQGLEQKLGIAPNILDTVILWVNSPEAVAEKVISFHKACQNGDPSKSHLILSHLAYVTNQQILTENLDPMQERMGTRPLRISKEVVSESDHAEEVDAIICVGLSKDDKGFLKVMKERHPVVKIIAVNPACPTYLGSDDFWCPMCAHDLLENLITDTLSQQISFSAFNH